MLSMSKLDLGILQKVMVNKLDSRVKLHTFPEHARPHFRVSRSVVSLSSARRIRNTQVQELKLSIGPRRLECRLGIILHLQGHCLSSRSRNQPMLTKV